MKREKPRLKDSEKLPRLMIVVHYTTDHSPVKRTIFVYEGEDENMHLSKAWRREVVRAEIFEVSSRATTRLKPAKTAGEWNAA